MSYPKLPLHFYRQNDVVQISSALIGKVICTKIGSELSAGIITETEAYCGRNDKASHAHGGKRTRRTEIMYQNGGCAYIYLCYGIHHLFNIVTHKEGFADAVLIRAVEPVDGTRLMLTRRGLDKLTPAVSAGPGRMSQALGITTDYYGTPLDGDTIWVEDRGIAVDNKDIAATKRIGVDYAGEDAELPWRFILKNSRWLS